MLGRNNSWCNIPKGETDLRLLRNREEANVVGVWAKRKMVRRVQKD